MERNSKEWLIANGFTGLFYDRECACSLEDYNMCCEDCTKDCTPGYEHSYMGDNPERKGDFCVSASKEQPTEKEWAEWDDLY